MAKKQSKISVNAVEEIVGKFGAEATETVEWCGLNIDVKPLLSLEETMRFVDMVASIVYDDESGNYFPELKDFLISCEILEMYTNVTLPSNTEKRYEMAYKCGSLVNDILDIVDKEQFSMIVSAIDSKIDYLIRTNANAINKKAEVLSNAIDRISNEMSTLFPDLTVEDVNGIISAIRDGKIDEKKLVDAYWDKKEQKASENDQLELNSK